MQTSDSVSVSCNLTQGGHASASDTHARVARAQSHYSTNEERELAIANLIWLSAYAPTHAGQVECRMLLLAMRHAQSFGAG